jgi:predicted phage tail protein
MSQLTSKAVSKIVDLISEGEIGGLLNAEKSIFLDGTPIQEADGTDNFEGVSFSSVNGTNTQSYLPGYAGIETSNEVNVKVKNGSPIIKTIYSRYLDAVRVDIFFPGLSRQDDGDMHGSSAQFRIQLRKGANGTWGADDAVITDTVRGKAAQRFDKTFKINIPEGWKTAGFSQVGVRVTRISADSTDDNVINDLYFGTYTEVVYNKLRYPNSALVGTQFDAEQFSSVPTRGYEIKGVKVKVPSNYSPWDPGHCSIGGYRRKDTCQVGGGSWTGTTTWPVTNLYSGSWDGTFKTEWTCNPAWILYDLCTNKRYGLGEWLTESQLDKWALYEIAKYCDAVDASGNFVGVDDGWGNKEARFACHLYLQTAQEAYKVLNDIAAVFRGLIYWQEGRVTPVQDAPKDPVMNFSEANVIGGEFVYEGSSKKQRHNVALVTWNNPEDLYKKNVEYVEDTEAIALANYQIISKSITALGCTSQSQAHRVGKWLLYTERYETELCTFKTGLEAEGLRPGDLIKIADSSRSGRRYGGRVASGSTDTKVQLDSATSVYAGKSYKLALINTETACVRGSCSNGSYTTQYDCELNGAIWNSEKQAAATEEACINAHIDNEWKPYVWIEQKAVNTVSSDANVTELEVTSAFENTPTANYSWILEEIGTVEAQDYRILSVREADSNIYEISTLKYHGVKYDLIEDNIEFSSKSTSSLPNPSGEVPVPENLIVTEELYKDSREIIKNRATFSWKAPASYPYIAAYYVEWRRNSPTETNWMPLGETTSTSITIEDAPAGDIEFRIKTKRIF